MTKGDIVLFKPAKSVITKGSDGLARSAKQSRSTTDNALVDSRLAAQIKQYDSPCVCYQVIGYWAYLYRLMDGGIHVAPCSEHWQCIDIDLSNYEFRLDIVTHLLEVGLG